MALNLGYFARESIMNFRRNWVMSLGAVITIYLSLLLVGVFVVSGIIVTNIVHSVEQKVSIRIFLKDGAASGDVDTLQKQLLVDPLVKTVRYVSKEEALDTFKKETMKDSPEIVEQIEGNPLPASLDVELKDPRTVEAMVSKIKVNAIFPKVADKPDDPEKSLKYGQQVVKKLFALTRIVRIVEAVFIIMLGVVSLVLIGNTIRLAIYSRRKEIAIMRLVGASNWFIRLPFLMEGMLQSLFGALLAIVTLALVQATVVPGVRDALPFLPITVTGGDAVQVAIVLIGSGLFIGAIGSGFAMRRFLKV